ncbi:MAG: sulfatase [Verrucomicrobiaceae bacterium]|nr:sulfatase [Verrucomicrobiaceae bacterium]
MRNSHSSNAAVRRLRLARKCALLCALAFSLAIPAAAEEERPNFLFIIFDDMSWNTAGAYGCEWVKTPNLDRVAREGVKFEHAFTSNPKCSPCRASILTGRNSWQLEELSVHNSIFPKKWAVFPDLLEEVGYEIGLTGKGWGPGDHTGQGWTRNPAGPSFDERKSEPPAAAIGKNDYAGNFEAFLSQRKDEEKPFSFWMGFQEPHRAYELHSGVRLGKNLDEIVVPPYFPDVQAVRSDLADYAIEVEWADQHIGRALDLLEKNGELDNTLIVITSDHGMPFPFVKGQIKEDGFRLPFVARWGKAIQPGRVVRDFVNVRDIAPTFLELAGVAKHPQITGSSLVPLLLSEDSGWITGDRKVMLVGKERHDLGRPNHWGYPVRAIRTPEFLYIHNYHPERWPACDPETNFGNCDDSPTKEFIKLLGGYYFDVSFGHRPADELYQLANDPHGVRNLANDPAFAGIITRLREDMLAALRAEGDPRALGEGAIFDTYEYVKRSAKDYGAWVAGRDEALSAEAERLFQEKRAKRRPPKAPPR